MVIANELLDNLPFDVYGRVGGRWQEVRVGADDDRLVEVPVAADEAIAARLDELAPGAPDGARVPWQAAAHTWLRDADAILERGRLIAFDYARSTAAMAAEGGWLRTYRAGGPGGAPLEALGEQDITADVALDQLQLAGPSITVELQGQWLDRHGLDELTRKAANTWQERAAIGDMAALRARSRVGEAAALRDPHGLGGFAVIQTDRH
jgi:SAM-dependent MidA family methyltransferase